MNKYEKALFELGHHFSEHQVVALESFIDFCLADSQLEIDTLIKQVDALERRLDNI